MDMIVADTQGKTEWVNYLTKELRMSIQRKISNPAIIGVLLALALELSSPPKVWADPRSVVTLEEAIGLAVQHNPLLAAARQDLRIAEAVRQEAYSAFLPKLEVSETYMRTNNPVSAFGTLLNQANFTSADFAVDRLNHPDPLNNFRLGFTLTQPIYNSHQELLGLRMARIGQEIAQDDLKATRQRVIFITTEAYYGLLLAKDRLKVAQEARRIADENLRQIRSRHGQGLVVKSDLLSAEVRLANVEEEQIRAEHGVQLARIALKNAIGIAEEVDAGEGLEKSKQIIPELDALKQEAKQSRPDYLALKNELEQAGVQVRLARSVFFPRLNLHGSYEVNNKTLVSDGSDSYTALAVLSLNLFNGLADQARIGKARAQQEKLKALLVERERGIELEVTRAYQNLAEALERTKVHEETLVQAEEHLRIVQNRYLSGITTILDLLTAEHLLTQAKMARIHSLYDHAVARARLELAIGRIGSE